jgi:hypothetical protein
MFLRINPEEYINTDEIISIKIIDQMTCGLTTENGYYTAEYPVETLLSILRGEKKDESQEIEQLKQMNQKIGELPIFAG